MIRSFTVISFVLFGLIVFGHTTASAQNPTLSSNISITPFLQQLTLSSDQGSNQFDLSISNDSKTAQTFSLAPVNFGSLDETGGLIFEGANSVRIDSYGLANWVVLDRDSVSLEPGEKTSVKVSITNGTDLTPGAHYAAIIVSGSGAKSSTLQLSLKPQVSSLIFLTKLGGEKYDMHLV